MRLIDADKLRVNCYCIDKICVDARTIEIAPTVEAIPIEWIKKWVEKCNWHYTDLPRIIETMLEDWEKENESRDTESTK